MENIIRGFLIKYVHNYNIQNSDDIFALGLVNSLFAMQLVMFIEKEFEVKIANEDLNLDNFRSIDAIINLVTKKQSSN